MLKPYPHQEKFIDENPNKCIMAWETRSGKSLPASVWIDKRQGETYIVCLKQNKKDWIRANTRATVLTKEEFKKYNSFVNPTAIVIDEAHTTSSPLFISTRRSQLSSKMYDLVKKFPDMHVLLVTATPVKNDAWSLHTLMCYIGVYYDWKKWREMFFELKTAPFLPFPAWFPKKDWRETLKPFVYKHCNIVSLKDIVKDLPPIDDQIIDIKHKTKYVRLDDHTWHDEHKAEQKDKEDFILNLGFRKIIVVCHYTYQIDELRDILSKDKNTYVLDGRVKDQDEVKRLAQADEDCYFIVQASMGMAFDGYMFGALVFVSMSHKCVDHTQMNGRTRHLEHLKAYTHYYLIGGVWDRKIFKTIREGRDFNPHENN